MHAILYIGHGTRSKKGVADVKEFLQKVTPRVDAPIQEIAFLELTEPLISEGFRRCVERGATEITVVPLFLLAAGHIKADIPNALEPLLKQYSDVKVNVADPFGVQGGILDAIAVLVKETIMDLCSLDSILIVGRGSSDPGIPAAFNEIAAGIEERLAIQQVHVCYLAASRPLLDEGLDVVCGNAAGRVIVIPYLLFDGILLNEVRQKVGRRQALGQQILHTGALSSHRVIEDIVVQRATNADMATKLST
ncbi:sirohydrochlorin chelatase [Bacillus canaveralius]|uniref:Sirohydrochlorin chelatase n=1 Tax=Bacillus canaveralius TaxID=1403243 RepID=A0A2N5GMF4_9BACI|nr:sirohydrochlorin chelatase [Bacillus canaveralius]PLR83025.1 sirohydrochlorin chelatase [Bacillus canaveralius]PLR96971.1 sirohydrochlorin chelatase [Bacillus canaveralius]RSK47936.1 sirohydrochlorin chelatase [Bacillus canaveralius]